MQPILDLVGAISTLLDCLGVRHTRAQLRHSLQTHPDYPKVFCVLETLDAVGVHADPVESSIEALEPGYSLVHLRLPNCEGLAPLEVRDDGTLAAWLGSAGWVSLSHEQLARAWSGVVIEVEAIDGAGELGLPPARDAYRRGLAFGGLGLAILLGIVFAAPSHGWGPFVLASMGLDAVGLAALLPLVAVHLGSHDSLKRWCPTRGRSSCSAVVSSSFGRIAGIPLADVGAIYFVAHGLTLGCAGLLGAHSIFSTTLVWLAVAGLAIFLASAVTQAFALRTWCRLCVAAGFALLGHALVAWGLAPLWRVPDTLHDPAVFAIAGLIAAACWWLARPLISAGLAQQIGDELVVRRLRTPEFLRAALAIARPVPPPPLGSTVPIGKPSAAMRVGLVMDLRCPRCASAMLELDRLVAMHPEEVRAELAVIPATEGDSAVFAAIAGAAPSPARDLLRSWCRDPMQDAETWLVRHRLSGGAPSAELSNEWRRWIATVELAGTPLLIVNERALPLGSSIDAVRALVFSSDSEA